MMPLCLKGAGTAAAIWTLICTFPVYGHTPGATATPAIDAQRILGELRHARLVPLPAEVAVGEAIPMLNGALLRYAQLHRGIPVLGAELTVRLDGAGRVARLGHGFVAPQELARISTRPRLTADEVLRIAGSPQRIVDGNAQLHIDAQTLRLVYVVPYAEPAKLTQGWLLIDAENGAILRKTNHVRSEGVFSAYDTNPVVTASPTSRALTDDTSLQPGPSGFLQSALLEAAVCVDAQETYSRAGAARMHACELRHMAEPNASGDYDDLTPLVFANDGHCPMVPTPNPFAEAHAYWHGARAYAAFRALYALRGVGDFRLLISTGPAALPFPLLVNLCIPDFSDPRKVSDPMTPLIPLGSAFFAPDGLLGRSLFGIDSAFVALGMGVKSNLAMDGDVVSHELTHAVIASRGRLRETAFQDDFGFNDEPGALNEGLADYFSSTLSGDPSVGEYAARDLPAERVRSLANRLHCSKDRVGEDHYDGQVFAAALWEGRQAIGSTPADTSPDALLRRQTFDAAVLAMIDGLSATPSFADAAKLLLDEVDRAAATLGADAKDKLKSAFAAHGVLPTCNRILDGKRAKPLLYLPSSGGLSPGHVQWRVVVPKGKKAVRVTMRLENDSGGDVSHLKLMIRDADTPIAWLAGSATYDRLVSFERDAGEIERIVNMKPGAHHIMIVNSAAQELARDITIEFMSDEPTRSPESRSISPDDRCQDAHIDCSPGCSAAPSCRSALCTNASASARWRSCTIVSTVLASLLFFLLCRRWRGRARAA